MAPSAPERLRIYSWISLILKTGPSPRTNASGWARSLDPNVSFIFSIPLISRIMSMEASILFHRQLEPPSASLPLPRKSAHVSAVNRKRQSASSLFDLIDDDDEAYQGPDDEEVASTRTERTVSQKRVPSLVMELPTAAQHAKYRKGGPKVRIAKTDIAQDAQIMACIPPSFVQFMRDHQRLVEDQKLIDQPELLERYLKLRKIAGSNAVDQQAAKPADNTSERATKFTFTPTKDQEDVHSDVTARKHQGKTPHEFLDCL